MCVQSRCEGQNEMREPLKSTIIDLMDITPYSIFLSLSLVVDSLGASLFLHLQCHFTNQQTVTGTSRDRATPGSGLVQLSHHKAPPIML